MAQPPLPVSFRTEKTNNGKKKKQKRVYLLSVCKQVLSVGMMMDVLLVFLPAWSVPWFSLVEHRAKRERETVSRGMKFAYGR